MAQVTTITTSGQLGTYHSPKRTNNPKSNNKTVDLSVRRSRELANRAGNFYTNHYNLVPKNNRRIINHNESNSIRMKAKLVPSSYTSNPGRNNNVGNDGSYDNNDTTYRKGKYLIKEAQNHYRQGGRRNQYMYWGSDLRVQPMDDSVIHVSKDRCQIRYENYKINLLKQD